MVVLFSFRYIAVEVNPLGVCGSKPYTLNPRDLYKSVIDTVQTLHGDFGVAAISAGFAGRLITTNTSVLFLFVELLFTLTHSKYSYFLAKYCNEVTRIALIRSRHGPHRILASTLPCVTHVGQKPATLRTIFTGATLKHCFLFLQVCILLQNITFPGLLFIERCLTIVSFQRYQRAALDRMWAMQRTDDERKALEAAVMDLTVVENFNPKRKDGVDVRYT